MCLYSACALAGLVRFLWEIWFFHLESGTIPLYCVLQFLSFISIEVNCLCISMVFEIKQKKPVSAQTIRCTLNQIVPEG